MNSLWLIIGICVVIFIVTMVNSGAVFHYLGLQPAALASRPWTVLTSLFVHASPWHLIFNMLTLFFFGSYMGRLVGEVKFLIVFFAGGLLGSAGPGTEITSTGTQTYQVEHTFDYQGHVSSDWNGFISSAAVWFANTGLTGATSQANGNYAFPVSMIRLNVLSGSSQGVVKAILMQA